MPNDFGPIYTETNLSNFPVEPWNTVSNVVFLLLIIYWFPKIKGQYTKHRLFTIGLPILAVGFIGGTVYHATRSHRIWLIMDFLPIFILVTLTAFHLWFLLTKSMKWSVLISAAFFILSGVARRGLPMPWSWRISLGYAIAALMIVLPAVLLCCKNKLKNIQYLLFTVLSFAIAILFRQMDKGYGAVLFPMGTHFLWHIFGGISVYYLMQFIYKFEISDLNHQ